MAVSAAIGYIKGKSAIHVARHFLMERERNYTGMKLWARGYFVDTVGRDTEVIRKYIRAQESEDKRLDQLEHKQPREITSRLGRLQSKASGFTGGDSLLSA